MKNMLSIFGFFFLLMGCGEEEVMPEQEPSIYGTWQLVEKLDGGSPVPIQTVEDGYLYEFNSNLTFSSSKTIGCPNDADIQGSFSLSSFQSFNVITLNIRCGENDNDMVVAEYIYSFEDDMLILSPKESTCWEGCYEKFEKIAEAEVFTD